jgi:uncharacterized protein (DUF983 family)
MFCPSCGFEYTQKTNYCKRCGESLSATSANDAPKMARPKLAVMFCVVAAFGILGMLSVFAMYDNLVMRGIRGDELMIPFMMGMVFTGTIAGLLIWQLARMITGHQKTGRNVIVEKHFIREAPPAQFGAPTDPIQQTVEPPSVAEHTTRQMANVYREPQARE